MDSVTPPPPPKLLDQLRERIRYRHFSLRTEQAYVHWVKRFIFFHNKKHPKEMGKPEVEAFLSFLANAGRVAISTHRQAFSALLFLYREVLGVELPWLSEMGRPKIPKRLPVVLTETEVRRVLDRVDGQTYQLMTRLLYGTGMRLMECVRLRVKAHLDRVREIWLADRAAGRPGVELPDALNRKYVNAAAEWFVSTTMIYTHVLNKGGRGVVSPLDR
jgi:integrase